MFKIIAVFLFVFTIFVNFSPSIIPLYGVWEWIGMAISLIAIAGMNCYAFKIRILGKPFWLFLLFTYCIFETIYIGWLGHPFAVKTDISTTQEWMMNAVNIIIDVPIVYGLFQLQEKWTAA